MDRPDHWRRRIGGGGSDFALRKAYRAMWVRYQGTTRFFDFADQRQLDDGWRSDGKLGRKEGSWQAVEIVAGRRCACGADPEWTTRDRLWCEKCWGKFAWVPKRRLYRFRRFIGLASAKPAPYEAVTRLGWKVISTAAAAEA